MIYFTENLPSSKISLPQIDNILNHACDILDLPEELSLEIEFTYDVEFPQYGDADVDEEDGALIRINRRASSDDIIVTLFHELVHVHQITAGKLSLGEGKQKSTWCGCQHDGEYFDLPWEREAFELEQYMMKTYKEKYDGIHG